MITIFTLLLSLNSFAANTAEDCLSQAKVQLKACRKVSWREPSALAVSQREVSCNSRFFEQERSCRRLSSDNNS